MAFGKKKPDPTEQIVCGILDSQNADIMVFRSDCEVLFANECARRRLGDDAGNPNCRRGFSTAWPDICNNCPVDTGKTEMPQVFDVHSREGRVFEATVNTIQWLDGREAYLMSLRDLHDERGATQKLYNMAYVDHLTSAPNRQKLRETFDAAQKSIISKKAAGVLAIFDLDNFKNINDTYGHNTGDEMLRKLIEHLEDDAAFKGHIYRLGGDEFVLLYLDRPDKFVSPQQMQEYYQNLLHGAFLSYTLPYIEDSCTLSMGAAFFPVHGNSYSELLRKADIALYKAKASGRNQLVIFEDHYDSAKKFKDLYINIQPILTSAGRTVGYEMVDSANTRAAGSGEDEMNLAEFDRTMDALGMDALEGDTLYFIGYSNQLLSFSVRKSLPKNKFVIQILLNGPISAVQMDKYIELHKYGYKLALDGVNMHNASTKLMGMASYVKFARYGIDLAQQQRMIEKYPNVRFIATGVDDGETLKIYKNAGFMLFQGVFFSQPMVVKKTKDIDPLKVNYYRLLKLSSTTDYVDFKEISDVIASDVALSYKLLRLLNSAAVGLRNNISSIDTAVTYLGEENLKKWISMLALRGVANDKPLELVRISLIRAQFGELLAPHFTPKRNPKHVFLTGMFSLLHIALEKTKEELLAEMPVAEEIRESLLTARGPHSDLLAFFAAYEYGDWDDVGRFARANGISDRLINDSYLAAMKWYNSLANSD